MEALKQVLQHLRLGPEVTHENLTMFPLLNGASHARDYQTLREALAAGTLRVTEVSEGGSVPQLSAVNDSDKPVLILDGEELVGAKQNRIANVTILVPAQRAIPIPVSCVEAGRWGYRSRRFSDSPHAMYAEARARKTRNVNDSHRKEPTPSSPRGSGLALLDSVASANVEVYPAVGLGQELRLQGNDVVGAALSVDGRVVHLTAFASAARDA